MTSPDAAAAVEHADPLVRDLTDDHTGMTIKLLDPNGPAVIGELAFAQLLDEPAGMTHVAIRELNRAYLTETLVPSDTRYRALTPEAAPPIRPIDTDLCRELASVSDRLRTVKGELKDLETRKKGISNTLVEAFVANDVCSLNVSGRNAYVHTSTYAQYNDRPEDEGGGKYTDEDLIPVLRTLGREELIKPVSVHSSTLASFLREFRDSETPVPDAVAKIVTLVGNPEIRVRA